MTIAIPIQGKINHKKVATQITQSKVIITLMCKV